ncbi:MAG: D-alanine--D-alanine ligase [Deltaproteobacteria bacterium]|nr:D-alanine--D-alanine ligase [Deltaproteobacteria bacterium]
MRVALAYNVKKEAPAAGDAIHLPDDYFAEWDEMETIERVRDALSERHGEVELVEADEDAYDKFRRLRPELVFNMAEGLRGEARESHIPAILELLDIPYTGSSPLTLALCLNKARAKEILSFYGIPTPRHFIVEDASTDIRGGTEFPLIVKPLYEGSSKGIRDNSIVHNGTELRERVLNILAAYGQPALVEAYLGGREFTVALLGNGKGLKVLPIVEIDYSSLPKDVNPIYSFEAKWVLDRPDAPLDIFLCPAPLTEELEKSISGVAEKSFRALGVRDWCRIDVRLDSQGVPNVLELNPLPGIIPSPESNSCFPKAARAVGMEFSELVNAVADIARTRYGI